MIFQNLSCLMLLAVHWLSLRSRINRCRGHIDRTESPRLFGSLWSFGLQHWLYNINKISWNWLSLLARSTIIFTIRIMTWRTIWRTWRRIATALCGLSIRSLYNFFILVSNLSFLIPVDSTPWKSVGPVLVSSFLHESPFIDLPASGTNRVDAFLLANLFCVLTLLLSLEHLSFKLK